MEPSDGTTGFPRIKRPRSMLERELPAIFGQPLESDDTLPLAPGYAGQRATSDDPRLSISHLTNLATDEAFDFPGISGEGVLYGAYSRFTLPGEASQLLPPEFRLQGCSGDLGLLCDASDTGPAQRHPPEILKPEPSPTLPPIELGSHSRQERGFSRYPSVLPSLSPVTEIKHQQGNRASPALEQTLQETDDAPVRTTQEVKVKGPWRPQEDELLQRLVEKYGAKRWTLIANSIPGRSGKQARERWLNQLSPGLAKRPWTQAEDLIIVQEHARLGNKWSEIAKKLEGRTDNAVKNRFNTTIRRQLRDGEYNNPEFDSN
eukprot:CAMPEP_0184685780 /NCGR_PEP_ID=MMETSP0312-20130426/20186_1 /TAXON_ID=31354 /ORGANISM="Compsopogon coeruleus, Strain SAG 36.94" /LENGTH=317 /DNA_ID=CAMNT_0027140231 /DNA_START=42 /DNA_END=995 /DNA_ORIENTATION=+